MCSAALLAGCLGSHDPVAPGSGGSTGGSTGGSGGGTTFTADAGTRFTGFSPAPLVLPNLILVYQTTVNPASNNFVQTSTDGINFSQSAALYPSPSYNKCIVALPGGSYRM